jgi:hypothetical protein
MRIHSVMFGSATVPLSLPSLTIRRGAATSFAAGVGLPRSGRHVARFVEIIVFAILLALMALPAPARAQTFTISSLTASPVTVQPGQTVTFSATITASQNASNYPVEFSLIFNGQNVTQKVFYLTFQAGASSIQAYSWTVPAGTGAGTYSMEVAVFNPAWSSVLAMKTAALTVAGATAGSAAASATTYPVLLEFPVVSGAAQVGDVLTSTTGTWTDATSFAYQWSGNRAPIAGATAATYIPVSSDSGHTLTSTVVATGSPGAKSSATSAATVPIVAANSSSSTASATGSVPFVALHTYYMSPTGSDSNNGLTAATAWATPNHSVMCGDVIIAAAGAYSPSNLNVTINPSTCPSTSGGIDGIGGVYFATILCARSFACTINGSTLPSGSSAIEINQTNNWAAEGWITTTSGGNAGCYSSNAGGGSTAYHHIAFVNDICSNAGLGFYTGGYGTGGTDYFAVVGNVAYDANQRSDYPSAAIVDVGPKNSDTTAGTHVYFAGNFMINSSVPSTSTAYSDLEGMMFDTWNVNGYVGAGVAKNNITYNSSNEGMNIFLQHQTASISTAVDLEIANNTWYGDGVCTPFTAGSAELNVQLDENYPWTINIYNNIGQTDRKLVGCKGGYPIMAMNIGGNYGISNLRVTLGGTGKQNFWYSGYQTSCLGPVCDPGDNVSAYNGFAIGGTTGAGGDIYATPSFKNTTDLLSNHLGQPSCGSFTNVTACMGWNYSSQTATALSIISDLTPTASGATGKGYQPPAPCASDALYPKWLKGIVYLQWNGSSLTENAGLINQQPCGL